MLQKLKTEIAECYQHALECRRRADDSSDPGCKQEFLGMEERWIQLAHSYDFAQRLGSFTDEVKRRQRRGRRPRRADGLDL